MENPFSTKFWASGTIPFQFSESGDSLGALQERARRKLICQIVGPHGSGKSALLLNLMRRYKEDGDDVRHIFLNDQHRRVPEEITFQKHHIIFADGFEQLRFGDRLWLLRQSKRLILTVHRPVWLVPILYRTKPQYSIFVQIVRRIAPDAPDESVLRAVYERSGGNFRSAFFELYDMWESLSADRCR